MARQMSFLVQFVLAFAALGSIGPPCFSAEADKPAKKEEIQERCRWIEEVLKEIETVKVGMTRQDLLKVFQEEGGLSTRRQRTHVYKGCPYIKVDVEFKPVGQEDEKLKEMPGDEIVQISRPYLQLSICD